MVELAFALMPTLALLFAIVDFCMPIFLTSTFNHAVREGARYAITYRTFSGQSHSRSIKTIVQQNSTGFLASSAHLDKISVRYYSPTTFAEVTGPNANAGGNIVEVRVQGFQWNWILPIWRSGTPITIGASSADRLEQLPVGAPRPAPF